MSRSNPNEDCGGADLARVGVDGLVEVRVETRPTGTLFAGARRAAGLEEVLLR